MQKIYLLLSFLLIAYGVQAQMLPISDQELVSTSENIVKGTVISSEPRWVNNGKYIYTFTKLKVDQNFSGTYRQGDTITIVTPGGYDPVADIGMEVSHQASFKQGEKSVLFLVEAKGERDAVDFTFLEKPRARKKMMTVNGFFQGKRTIFLDQKTNKMMIIKPNENRVIELSSHNQQLQQKVDQKEQNIQKF